VELRRYAIPEEFLSELQSQAFERVGGWPTSRRRCCQRSGGGSECTVTQQQVARLQNSCAGGAAMPYLLSIHRQPTAT
jgi:hypothetical protein